eukprot:CAMPEP_0206164528 /NCGR_PEP_ID=MMETSP1474-20131121/16782_1 /ASSEMBLY_ACC=CAM_ASM_001110 /TAXON_ID=97495 /ORGANISM="Imantonia sp., Strain RCC918" /LENGTH=278 /DNA_ID=CAMNT_0053567437 /DNA_START=563 /DNA_END=1399 /DNA_ORIENTATION=-
MIGLAAPLALAGYNLTWVHTGLLSHPRVLLNPPSWLSLDSHVELNAGAPIRDFALAMAVGETPGAAFVLRGFEAPPGSRQPEQQRDWLPLSAYSVPFARGCTRQNRAKQHHRCHLRSQRWLHKMRQGGIVGLITRSGARKLSNVAQIVKELRPFLITHKLSILIMDEHLHTPAVFSRLSAVIGVHGTAFGNVHASNPGTVVIEITGRLMPRTWSNFAIALGMNYFSYVAKTFPRSRWTFHAHDRRSDVDVDVVKFASFVAQAIEATLNSSSTACDAQV